MFILDENRFGDSDLNNARGFIDFWAKYYPSNPPTIGNSKERISYNDELSLGNDLTKENVKRLLRWKSPQWLTEKSNGGNEKVNRVLKVLQDINHFRNRKINEDAFCGKVRGVFPNGLIWTVFLFHIARPYEFPIADSNVFLAFSTISNTECPNDWEGYKKYKTFFFNIAKSVGFIERQPNGTEPNIFKIVSDLKTLDNALFIFGKFLNTYCRLPNHTKSTPKKNLKHI